MRRLTIIVFLILAGGILFYGFYKPTPAVIKTAQLNPTPTIQTVLGVMTKSSGCQRINNALPDSACTPGAVDPNVSEDTIRTTICVAGYTKTVRPAESLTNKIKTQEMQMYGDTDSSANYELDHLISLELGGCPDCIANLWPEPYNIALGARQKDTVENYLHKQVCEGRMSISEAQADIARNWVDIYNQLLPK